MAKSGFAKEHLRSFIERIERLEEERTALTADIREVYSEAKGHLAAIAYLISGVLFIMALRGLSSPVTSRAGNRNGMIGMALAVATTLWVAGVTDPVTWALIAGGILIGGGVGAVTARRIAMTDMPQLVAAFHSLVGLAAVLVAGAAFYSPAAFGIGAEGAIRMQSLIECPWVSPSARSRSRPDHRLRKAQWQHERRADHPADAPRAEHPDLRGDRRAHRLFHNDAAGMDLLGDCGAQLRVRHHAHHPHRRRGHARRGVDAQFLFGLGGGRDGLHAGELGADHHRRAGRLSGAILSYIMCKGTWNCSFVLVIKGGFGGEAVGGAKGPAETRPVKQGRRLAKTFLSSPGIAAVIPVFDRARRYSSR